MSFISYLINGISLGSVYAIIALGYTMVYGIAKMLNFAHGDIIMVGGYAAFISMNSLGVNPILAVILSVVSLYDSRTWLLSVLLTVRFEMHLHRWLF